MYVGMYCILLCCVVLVCIVLYTYVQRQVSRFIDGITIVVYDTCEQKNERDINCMV